MEQGQTLASEEHPPGEKILVIGPGGAGKSFAVRRLRQRGINALDADAVPGLLRFLDRHGHDVPFPDEVDAAWFATHRVVWDLDVLHRLLADKNPVYLFGLSGNAFDVCHLFDRTYFLRADAELIERRLRDPSRHNPVGRSEEQRQLILGGLTALQQRAEAHDIPLIEASLCPEAIFAAIASPPAPPGERTTQRV